MIGTKCINFRESVTTAVGGGNLTTLVIPVQLPGKIDPWCMHEVGNAENCEDDHADADVDNDADVDAEIRDGENPGMPN